MNKKHLYTLTVLSLLSLSGCGQTGPLYLPGQGGKLANPRTTYLIPHYNKQKEPASAHTKSRQD